MFAYCNNNPVMCSDSSSHAACTWDGGFWDLESMSGLVDTGGGGGRVAGIPGCNGESARRHSAEIIHREKDYIRGRIHEMASNVGDALYSVGTTLWDAYMRSYNIQQQAQLQNSQALIEGTEYFVNNPQKAETLLRDMTGASVAITSAVSVALAGGPIGVIAGAIFGAGLAIWDVCWTIGEIIADFQ